MPRDSLFPVLMQKAALLAGDMTTPVEVEAKEESRLLGASRAALLLEDRSEFQHEGITQYIRLTTTRLEYGTCEDAMSVIFLDDTIGCKVEVAPAGQSDGNSECALEVYLYPRAKATCFQREPMKRCSRHVRFAVRGVDMAKRWEGAIWEQLEASKDQGPGSRHGRRFLVFVNPVSGTRCAPQTYATVVEPMLRQAGIEHKLIRTERMHHATEVVMNSRNLLSEWDGIIVVGGDGLLSEVVNGLYMRDSEGLSALKGMPLGIVKGGTGNGLFASMLYHSREGFYDVNAMFVIIKGRAMPMDLSLVQTASERHTSFLSLSWGLIADVDIESEAIRWMGAARTDLWSLYTVMRQRRYKGRLSYLPITEPETARVKNTERPKLPPLDKPLPEDQGWVTIEDDFLMVLVSHVSHIGETVHTAPGKVLGDGALQLLVLRKPVTRFRLLELCLQLSDGRHVQAPEPEVYWARAYRLLPLTTEGVIALDGERVHYGHVQGEILPQVVSLMSSLKHLEDAVDV